MGYTSAQAKAFIQEIAPYAQKAYKEIGKVYPSICIGMAIVESAAGTSSIMRKNNAFLGQKVGTGKTATKYWSGKFFDAKTKEEYTVGTHTIIKDAFRAFDSIEQGIFNYYELLNTSLYKNVLAGVDYKTQMAQIKACGYMTSSTEVNSVISLISKYDLTKYDSDTPNTQSINNSTYTVGKTYITNVNLNIREQPFGEKMKFSCITNNAQQHSIFDEYGNAILKAGTRVTCKAISVHPNSIWILIPSGWVCAVNAGKVYIN